MSKTLTCQLTDGTNCPSMICPNTAVNYICNASSYAGSNVWAVPRVGACNGTMLSLPQGPPWPGSFCLNSSSSVAVCGPFTAANTPPLTNNIYCLTSTLCMVVTSAMNGLNVSCCNWDGANYVVESFVNSTISVASKLRC